MHNNNQYKLKSLGLTKLCAFKVCTGIIIIIIFVLQYDNDSKIYMHEYSIKPFDLVQNSQYKYYKLSIDGYCQFDDFKEEIDNSTIKKEKAAFNRIISYMSMISDSILLPEKKFRQIHNVGRKDVFEFKKDDIRVYVVMQKPDIFVVLGGYKKKQSADIRALKRNLDGFKTI